MEIPDLQMKNCIIYIRVSSEKQVDGYSLDSQDDLCRKRAEQDGYSVIKVFREEGLSATTTNRPQLQELLSCCKDKKNSIDAVFVYSFSRLNRNTVDFLTIRHLLAKSGVSLISVTEPSGDSPEQRFIETILAAKDQYENESRARNVANSMRKRFLEGHITSKPPLGYLMQKVNGKSIVIKDPNSFEIVKSMWNKVINERLSTADVARKWNKAGFKSKHDRRFSRWNKQSIAKILSNKFYMGILVSEKYGETQGKHEQMIDETTFYSVREIMVNRVPFKSERYKCRNDFPLRGIVTCIDCRRKLSSGWSQGKLKKYAYYSCPSRGLHKSISYQSVTLERKFSSLLKSIEVSSEFMDLFSEILKEKYNEQFMQLNDSQDKVKQDIKTLEGTKKLIREKNVKGIYTDEEYLEMKEEIETDLAIKNGLLSEKKIDKIEVDTALQFMKYYLSNLEKIFFKATPEGKLKIGCSIFPDGVVFDGQNFRTPELGRIYKLTRDFSTTPSNLVSRQGLEP